MYKMIKRNVESRSPVQSENVTYDNYFLKRPQLRVVAHTMVRRELLRVTIIPVPMTTMKIVSGHCVDSEVII